MTETQKRSRLDEFKARLWKQLGYSVVQVDDGWIDIQDGSYIVDEFRSLQAAIDRYARYLPVDFVNP